MDHDASAASTTGGLPIAPALAPSVTSLDIGLDPEREQRRLVTISLLAIGIAFIATGAAEILLLLINGMTNLAYFGRWSFGAAAPADNTLGPLAIAVPIVGALVVGVIARYGSPAIRGHGIPEAMERVLYNESRISPRVALLKPLSAAVSIGTGGPFGAEGPIIATGGALGSLLGQLLHTTADERKTLLAAGAAAGMTAIFGTPVSAVLLAVELLLFEYRPRSLIPVALASCVAMAMRATLHGTAPIFPMAEIAEPSGAALAAYIALGAIVGLASVYVTRGVYAVEDAFEKIPLHWMWWPAIGAVAVGVIGYFEPRTLGVGYNNISDILTGSLAGHVLLVLVGAKLVSWMIALGSGTSGGTLAPLLTIGGGCGALLGGLATTFVPSLGIDVRVAALVGMAAMFAGASRAVLTSVVLAFELTRQPLGLLPLLGGCSTAYLVSLLRMPNSIMTERLSRRGTPVRTEYAVDHLSRVLVRDFASTPVVSVPANQTLAAARVWLATDQTTHQGFPVISATDGMLVGVVTRRELQDPGNAEDRTIASILKHSPVTIETTHTLRDAADRMVRARVGRLPVVDPAHPGRVVGILSRSDLLAAHVNRLDAEGRATRSIDLLARGGQRRTI